MDTFLVELLKQSPAAAGCVISIFLFIRAMRDRDAVFLEALRAIHQDNRNDKEKQDEKSDHLFERNIDALAKNTTALGENRDVLNEARIVIYAAKKAT